MTERLAVTTNQLVACDVFRERKLKMSYDVSVGMFDANYTSNVAELFYDHIPDVNGKGGLHRLHGKTGGQALTILTRAFELMNNTYCKSPKQMTEKYDAENGWGSALGATIFLGQLMAACATYPHDIVNVSA